MKLLKREQSFQHEPKRQNTISIRRVSTLKPCSSDHGSWSLMQILWIWVLHCHASRPMVDSWCSPLPNMAFSISGTTMPTFGCWICKQGKRETWRKSTHLIQRVIIHGRAMADGWSSVVVGMIATTHVRSSLISTITEMLQSRSNCLVPIPITIVSCWRATMFQSLCEGL